jgi:hypothetical protein
MAHRCISFEEHALHSACASWACDSQIRALCDEKELRRLDGAQTMLPTCLQLILQLSVFV